MRGPPRIPSASARPACGRLPPLGGASAQNCVALRCARRLAGRFDLEFSRTARRAADSSRLATKQSDLCPRPPRPLSKRRRPRSVTSGRFDSELQLVTILRRAARNAKDGTIYDPSAYRIQHHRIGSSPTGAQIRFYSTFITAAIATGAIEPCDESEAGPACRRTRLLNANRVASQGGNLAMNRFIRLGPTSVMSSVAARRLPRRDRTWS